MLKQELVDHIHAQTGLTKTDSKGALDAVLDGITKALVSGDDVRLPGFCTMSIRRSPARTMQSPMFDAPIHVEARNHVVFKAGKTLKDAINS